MNKIFNKVPVQIQNKSGFDLSHSNSYTMKVGTLYPVLVDQLIPGDTISLGHITEVQLPPMATDFYGRVQLKLETFFCPNRLCYGGFQQFITQPTNNQSSPNGYPIENVKYLPASYVPLSKCYPGSLADMLGLKYRGDALPTSGVRVNNVLPFIAYHRIWDDWYRDSLIQTAAFSTPYQSRVDQSPNLNVAAYVPYMTYPGNVPVDISPDLHGFNLFDLRQRCWSKDYFTNAKLSPQAGTPSVLAFNVADNIGSFTIASLRAANSLQQWMERNNVAGSRYISQIHAHYGVTPSDAVMDRPVYLGSHSFDIYNKSVYKSTDGGSSTNNPMNSVGSKYSSPLGVGDNSLVDSYSVTEFGFLFVIASIVPDALYSSGSRRYLDYGNVSDFANPILSSVGDQEIKKKELQLLPNLDGDDTFGYTQRYSEYKFMLDEVHGELVDGQSLDSFVLQRSFSGDVDLSTSFIEIPQNYMDQVTAVTAHMSNYGAWAHSYFTYKKSSVLPAYSIPTLGDPKDTHTEIINNGGPRL